MGYVLVCAGEPSSDLHAAGVVAKLKEKRPDLRFIGVGGPALQRLGFETLFSYAPITHTGLTEVVKHIPAAICLLRNTLTLAKAFQPDVALLVDSPDFNMRLLKKLNRAGIPVVYFIAPQVWAWRSQRVHALKKYTKRLYVIFPFEVGYFKREGLDVQYVGHPFMQKIYNLLPNQKVYEQLGVEPDKPIVALLPGSRYNEIKKLWPLFVHVWHVISKKHSNLTAVVPLAPGITRDIIEGVFAIPKNVIVTNMASVDILSVATIGLVSSGSATLEAGLVGLPMVVAYKVSMLTYLIAKSIVRIDHIGMVNLLSKERVVPEFVQNKATKENIANALLRYLDDDGYLNSTRSRLFRLREVLGDSNAYKTLSGSLLKEFL